MLYRSWLVAIRTRQERRFAPAAELLSDLIAEGLGSLRVVGPDVDVHKRPVLMLAGQFGCEPVDVVIAAIHGHERATVDGGRNDLLLLEVGWHEHDRADPGTRRRSGDGVGQVSSRWTGQDLEAHRGRGGKRHGHNAVFERMGGVAAVVLHPQPLHAESPGEVVRAHQSGTAGLGVWHVGNVRGHGQQARVTPDIAWSGLDRGTRERRQIVGHLEGPEALLARVPGPEIARVPALTARQARCEAETASRQGW